MRTVQHACDDHDVTFFESDVSHDGGKIMLVAGAPRRADHLEERSLRVARQILDIGSPLPADGHQPGQRVRWRLRSPFRRTHSVKGDAINLAARLVELLLGGGSVTDAEHRPPLVRDAVHASRLGGAAHAR